MKEITNKNILITGAANGIGARMTRDLLAKGAHVTACDVDRDKLTELFGDNDKCHIEQLDVRQPGEWLRVIQNMNGAIDVLLNIAGVIKPGYLQDLDADLIDIQIDVNLKGLIYGTKYAAEKMALQRGGIIVNFASMAALAPVPGIGIYTASKFGVRGFSLAMAQELKDKNIRVCVVCPDAVDTNMLDDQMDSKAAALTFSGDKILTVKEVSDAVIREVILGDKAELWLPMSRGIQAYLGATFPKLASFLIKMLTKKGLKKQEAFRSSRKS